MINLGRAFNQVCVSRLTLLVPPSDRTNERAKKVCNDVPDISYAIEIERERNSQRAVRRNHRTQTWISGTETAVEKASSLEITRSSGTTETFTVPCAAVPARSAPVTGEQSQVSVTENFRARINNVARPRVRGSRCEQIRDRFAVDLGRAFNPHIPAFVSRRPDLIILPPPPPLPPERLSFIYCEVEKARQEYRVAQDEPESNLKKRTKFVSILNERTINVHVQVNVKITKSF